jgi:hypothetical protein
MLFCVVFGKHNVVLSVAGVFSMFIYVYIYIYIHIYVYTSIPGVIFIDIPHKAKQSKAKAKQSKATFA